MKIPNPKHQIPNNFEIQISNFGYLGFEFVWKLGFVIWDLH